RRVLVDRADLQVPGAGTSVDRAEVGGAGREDGSAKNGIDGNAANKGGLSAGRSGKQFAEQIDLGNGEARFGGRIVQRQAADEPEDGRARGVDLDQAADLRRGVGVTRAGASCGGVEEARGL